MRQTLSPPFGAPAPDRTLEDLQTAITKTIQDAVARGSQIRIAGSVTGCNGAPIMAFGDGADCHAAAAGGKRYLTATPVGGAAVLIAPVTGRGFNGNEGFGNGTMQGSPVSINVIEVNANSTLRCIPSVPVLADTRYYKFFTLADDNTTALLGSKTEAPWTFQMEFARALKVIEDGDIVLWVVDTGVVGYTLAYEWEHGGFGAASKAFCPTLSHDQRTLILLQPREVSETGDPFRNHINMVFDARGPTPTISYWTYTGPDDASYWGPVQDWGATTAAFVGDTLAVVTGRPTMTGTDPANPTAMSIQLFDPPYTALAAELDLDFTVTGINGVALPIAGSADGGYLVCGTWEDVSGVATVRSLAVFEAPYNDADVPTGVLTNAGYRIDNPQCVKWADWFGDPILFVVWTKEADGTIWLGAYLPSVYNEAPNPLTADLEMISLGAIGEVDYMTLGIDEARIYISTASTVLAVAGPWTGAGAEVVSYANPGASVPGVFGGTAVIQGALTVTYVSGAPSLVAGVRQRTLTLTWTYTGVDDLPTATLVFPLPTQFTWLSATDGGTHEGDDPGGKAVWSLGPLVTDDTGTVDVTVSY
jgi:hypothetical protein